MNVVKSKDDAYSGTVVVKGHRTLTGSRWVCMDSGLGVAPAAALPCPAYKCPRTSRHEYTE